MKTPGKGRFFLFLLSPAYHWSIISTRRLVTPKLSWRSWLPYAVDLAVLGAFAIWYFTCWPELAQFSVGRPVVKADPQDLRILALPVLFASFAVPVHIAILRRHRMPQIAEWLCLYAGQIAWGALFVFGGLLAGLYADLHGYSHCYDAKGYATYALAPAVCPLPAGGE